MGVSSRRQALWVLALLAALANQSSAAEVVAIAGEPFGVAEVNIPLPPEDVGLPLGRLAMLIDGPPGRICYPAATDGVLSRLFGDRIRAGARLYVTFLFRGDQPFDITVRTPSPQILRVVPRRGRATAHARLLRKWWRDYNDLFEDLADRSEHQPLIESYLTSMMARRLGFDKATVDQLNSQDDDPAALQTIQL
jgi:hypothetical protein